MAEDLRISLAKKKVEQPSRNTNPGGLPWSGKEWNRAIADGLAGIRSPEIRQPVVISPNSLITTAEDVQRYAGMKAPPELITTVELLDTWPPSMEEGDPVVICDLNHADSWELLMTLEYDTKLILFHGRRRAAYIFKSVRKRRRDSEESA